MSAALHLRGDALIGGRFAIWVWDAFDEEPSDVDVLLLSRNAGSIPGVVIRRTPAIHREDVRWRKGLPITSPARSWLDFAAVGRLDEVESALAVIRRQKLATDKQLQATWERMPKRAPGRRLAEELLTAEPGSLSLTRSIYERRLIALIAAAKLAAPRTNIRVGPYEVDVAYLDEKVIVEFDGWKFHKGTFREDRSRDAWLAAHGWLVLRFTADRVDHEPLAVAAEIAATLALRGRRSA